MKTIALSRPLPYAVEVVWPIFAEVTRCDWVPGVDEITHADGIRRFTMAGIGEVAEKILKVDAASHCLQYSAISTPSGIDHHLATLQLEAAKDDQGCVLHWTTEIEPDAFAPAVEQAMLASLAQLEKVLAAV